MLTNNILYQLDQIGRRPEVGKILFPYMTSAPTANDIIGGGQDEQQAQQPDSQQQQLPTQQQQLPPVDPSTWPTAWDNTSVDAPPSQVSSALTPEQQTAMPPPPPPMTTAGMQPGEAMQRFQNSRGGTTDVPNDPGSVADAIAGGKVMPNFNSPDPQQNELAQQQWLEHHAENKDKGWKGRLKEILQNFGYAMNQAYQQNPNQDWKALIGAGGIGAGLGSFGQGRNWNERRAAAMEIPRIQQDIAFKAAQQKEAAAANEQNARASWYSARPDIEQGKVDNESTKISNLHDWRDRQLSDREQTQLDRMRRNFRLSHPYFDPSKASPADRAQLAQFGETPESMGSYDYTNPKVQKSAGSTFQYNPTTKSWVDSGIPKDESQETVEYQAYDPTTKITRTYKTTSEKAAALVNHLEATGMQIDAAGQRQQSAQNFTASQNATKAAAVKSYQDAVLGLRQTEINLRKNGDERGAAAAADRRTQLESTIRQRVHEGKLTEDDARDILSIGKPSTIGPGATADVINP